MQRSANSRSHLSTPRDDHISKHMTSISPYSFQQNKGELDVVLPPRFA